MADRSDDSLLREIDEEIRQERYAALWKKYGTFVIAGAILLVIAVAGWQGWKTWDRDTRTAETEILYQLVQSAKSSVNGLPDQALEPGVDFSDGPQLLAAFQQAAMLIERNEKDRAADVYRSIAADSKTPKAYADLAVIKGTTLEIDFANPPQDLEARLGNLTGANNPWRHIAKELLAVLALRNGDTARASILFGELRDDATTPAGIKARASQLADTLGAAR